MRGLNRLFSDISPFCGDQISVTNDNLHYWLGYFGALHYGHAYSATEFSVVIQYPPPFLKILCSLHNLLHQLCDLIPFTTPSPPEVMEPPLASRSQSLQTLPQLCVRAEPSPLTAGVEGGIREGLSAVINHVDTNLVPSCDLLHITAQHIL